MTAHSRTSLPIPDIAQPGYTAYDAKDPDSEYPAITPLMPPVGSPNVLLVLLDDAGYGASSAFGGPCQTPNLERLAGNGLRYTKFHTTALCSPTRASLLSGRNHHTVNMGGITEIATAAPGYTSQRPNTCAPLAEILKLNGYSTAQIGKCHEIPVWETSPMGPFDNWPCAGGGFEYFFGFVGGETNQYYPSLYQNTSQVDPSGTPEDGYTLNEELADKAIDYLRRRASLTPEKPFFMYYAPGATHAPHHVPQEWADRYKGVFDQGWDKLREETLARQIELGTVPPDTELTERSPGLPSWDDQPEELKPALVRQAEVYAGFMTQTDYHIGRILDELEDQGIIDDTLVIAIWGDNGASAEGTLQGSINEMITLNGLNLETPEMMIEAKERLGSPGMSNHYAASWAHAMNTPFQWTKQVASHFGGTRNPMVVHWPARIGEAGVRTQFGHVSDIAPTILELAGLPEPTVVNGVQQRPMEGTSLAYTFDEPDAAERHDLQYFEMFGNRAVYYKGWTAVTKHRTPWETGAVELPAFDDDVWELYDTATDWSQAKDLAAEHPDRLREMQRLWLIEAVKYNVVPIDDRAAVRAIAKLAGRPELITGTSQRLYSGMSIPEQTALNTQNRSWALTASITVPEQGADGVIVSLGGDIGGWVMYVLDGVLIYGYNFLALDRTRVRASAPLEAGKHEVRMEFIYDGGGTGQGGTATLFVDGTDVGSARLERTVPGAFTGSETCTVGRDPGSRVIEDYPEYHNGFTGSIDWVQIDVDDIAADHHAQQLDHKVRIAMGTQ
ncbi:putative arylsulfatase [Gordonia araii NBRC 100433]|uniref:Putative arylsulfatase n=1 Tax=Gordonia araii NBRC 100433 TaxID=1073574 RepID=G7GYZ7_9ACTN|nr:arylsulfatase [Gordonia araii]NNG97031.1 arylsulfatase [Gordonia araii NBRC 100433]GAB08822.1 putative arylsulfatase [Gordonia araii NBRC 100433]